MTGRNLMNLDSLLDTLTNVVGFLVIVLAVLQISVISGVSQTDRSTVQGGIDRTRRDTAKLNQDRRDLSESLTALKDTVGIAQSRIESADPSATAYRRRAAESAVNDLATTLGTVQETITRLRNQLKNSDSNPESTERINTGRIIHVVDSSKNGRKRIGIVCSGGRVLILDSEGLLETTVEELTSVTGSLPAPPIKSEEHFKKNDIGDPMFRVSVFRSGMARYVPRRGAGDSISDLKSGHSLLEKHLRSSVSTKDVWIKFFVWEDSFPTYLQALAVADQLGFVSGWAPYSLDEHYEFSLSGGGGGGREDGPQY